MYSETASLKGRIPLEGVRYTKKWARKTKKTVTLDSFLYKKKFPKLCLIKIDVEGHEFDVLRGAKETISKYKPIIYIEN